MPRGTNRPLRDSDRLSQAEREIADLKRTVANLLRAKPRTHPATLELAETIDDEDYPTGEATRFPIVFVDFKDGEYTPRSASRQAFAATPKPIQMPAGTRVFVKSQRNGGWMVVQGAGFRKFFGKTGPDGIPACGAGEVTVYRYDPEAGSSGSSGSECAWRPMLRSELAEGSSGSSGSGDGEPLVLTVHHPPPPEDVDDVPGDTWVQCEIEDASGLWIVDVEYCPRESSTGSSAGPQAGTGQDDDEQEPQQ